MCERPRISITVRGATPAAKSREAQSCNDLIEFLRRAGLPDAWDLLDDPNWLEWRGGCAHP
ncbi:hypothetical protein [Streptomyces chiangmaiensis]|uniref:hypothetical protein n=1 Tax=Streptomyces chiangmaiensis TaxID=766497 RepID=UPI003CD08F96